MTVTRTNGIIKFTSASDATGVDKFLIQGIHWTGGADGDSVMVQDQDDEDIWGATADASELNHTIFFNKPIQVEQINISTLDAGTVYVYL